MRGRHTRRRSLRQMSRPPVPDAGQGPGDTSPIGGLPVGRGGRAMWTDALRYSQYDWARRHASQFPRDGLDALLDNTSDICRDAAAGVYAESTSIPSRLDHEE